MRCVILGVKEPVPGRLLHLTVREGGVVIHLLNVYAPTAGPQQTTFYGKVSAHLDTIAGGECIILGGDFNCTLEARDRTGPWLRTPAVVKLRDLLGTRDLVDVWRHLHPGSRAFTFVKPGGGASRIDRLYVSRAHVSGVPSASVRQVPCTDHHLVWAEFVPSRVRGGSAYWHFNNTLLEDERFLDSFRRFWAGWRRKRGGFPSLRLWWDVGKTHVRVFCQEYARGSTRRRKSRSEELEKEVFDLEARLSQPDADPALRSEYREKKGALRDLQLVGSRGASTRWKKGGLTVSSSLRCWPTTVPPSRIRRASGPLPGIITPPSSLRIRPARMPAEFCGRTSRRSARRASAGLRPPSPWPS